MDENVPNELTSLKSEKISRNSKMSTYNAEKKSQWIQIILSVIANTSILSTGMGLGFPAVSINTLSTKEGFTSDQISWFGKLIFDF